jgi:hypothetical protein
MTDEEAVKFIRSRIAVQREDIARAKSVLIGLSSGDARSHALAWLKAQNIEEVQSVQPSNEEQLLKLARAYSLRKAFYHALFQLVAAGEMIVTGPMARFQPLLGFAEGSAFMSMQVQAAKQDMGFSEPQGFERISLPDDISADPDIFLQGINCGSLHSGILEAVEQSLRCFKQGLYMPATAMLAAGAEATWTECGIQVAKHLSDARLDVLFSDQYASISRKVADLRKALEQQHAKQLLKNAGVTIAKVNDAEVWTTVLRDRRNALHWGKAKSFIADYSETATLLTAAPLHISTLEAIRVHC